MENKGITIGNAPPNQFHDMREVLRTEGPSFNYSNAVTLVVVLIWNWLGRPVKNAIIGVQYLSG